MLDRPNVYPGTKDVDDPTVGTQIYYATRASDEASPDDRTVIEVESLPEVVEALAPPHPLEEELAGLQRALEALEDCPPQRWTDRMLWRAMRWVYRRQLQRTVAALEASVAGEQGLEIGAEYDFEPHMILIPRGEFLMGSDPQQDSNALGAERPQSPLYLADYYLAQTPVTNAQYEAFVSATGHDLPRHWVNGRPPRGQESHPVVSVSWYDAAAYCHWLSTVTGRPYRLPTEAEWEKAARGRDGYIYPWGNRWDAQRCNTKESEIESTVPVGTYPQGASPYDLMDMAGNVWEWTSSLYWGYPYRATDGREDPTSPDSRVLRGGSWLNSYDSARTAYRRRYVPAYHSRIHGFRPCMSRSAAPGDSLGT